MTKLTCDRGTLSLSLRIVNLVSLGRRGIPNEISLSESVHLIRHSGDVWVLLACLYYTKLFFISNRKWVVPVFA